MGKRRLVGRRAQRQSTTLVVVWRYDDTDIIKFLDNIVDLGEETKADYIRRLIRKDIKKQKKKQKKNQNELN